MFNCAKVLKGSWIVDTNEFAHWGGCTWEIISGEANIVPGKPFFIYDSELDRNVKIEVSLIFPISDRVYLWVEKNGKRKNISLTKTNDRNNSIMYRQRL